ncbi:MAG: thiamine biosynthesis protein ThiS [Desulfuromonas sp.]|nr:MAG: thiamine biosynthesis protein ThiS [Desulfuromonas sp.]
MQITLNGHCKEVTDNTTVAELLTSLGLDPTRVAIELNQQVISRERFGDTLINAGDSIEIVQFVGGG